VNIDVTTEIDINRPRAEVAAFAADPDAATSWYEDIKAVRWETPRPVQVGSRIAFEARFLGRRLAYTYEIRDFEAGVRLVMSTDTGPFPMETTYTWRDTPGGATRMTLRNRGEPSGFANLAAPLLSAQVRRATTRNLRLLKKILEQRPAIEHKGSAGAADVART
jgi:polyketide cyclase/dehydrase/lipid transport protein